MMRQDARRQPSPGRLLAAAALCASFATTTALAAIGTPDPAGTAEAAAQAKAPQAVDPATARMPSLPPAVLDDALSIGGSEIEARKLASRMTVAVHVNGTGPYRFVVDSGADSSVVGQRIAAALSLPAGRRVILNTITDSQIVDRVLVDELTLGPTKVRDLELPVLRERDLGAAGMLGLDALVEQRLMLDFEKRIITVDDGRVAAPRQDGEIVVTARLRKGQLILTEVRANRRAVEAVVDTGSQVTIGNAALRNLLLRNDPKLFTEIEVTGVTGVTTKLQLAKIRELKLGSVVLHDVPVAFADVPPFHVFGLESKPSLLLGTDLMETFRRVSLDFRNRKVRFQLKRCGASVAIAQAAQRYRTRVAAAGAAACAR